MSIFYNILFTFFESILLSYITVIATPFFFRLFFWIEGLFGINFGRNFCKNNFRYLYKDEKKSKEIIENEF